MMNKYINRELSWLDFNDRVLLEAKDPSLNLIDQLKFISIFSTNLDEFIMVRMGSLKDQINVGYDKPDISGLTPKEQFSKAFTKIRQLVKKQESLLEGNLKRASENGFQIVKIEDLSKKEIDELRIHFEKNIFPVLTPLAVDGARPFPLLSNKAIYLAIRLSVDGKESIALVQIPSILSRVQEISRTNHKVKAILLEDIIIQFLDQLFPEVNIESVSQFRITRNGDLPIDEDDAEDLLLVIENSLKQRKWGEVIRLEVKKGYDPDVIRYLNQYIHIHDQGLFETSLFLDMSFLIKIKGPVLEPEFQRVDHHPRRLSRLAKSNVFKEAKKKDVFLQFPYDSFDHIAEFVKQASEDDQVLAIKQTLYRVNGDSEIIKYLSRAAENGKQVTVLVELKARFDEQNNIHWAKQLEKTGANVIYGVPGLKTHSKFLLVVRKEEDGIKRYVNIATGNYNAITAKLYTDFSMITTREDIAQDASALFNRISGYAKSQTMNRLVYAPEMMRDRLLQLIQNEKNYAIRGKRAEIKIIVNSLLDKEIIDALYDASQAGVLISIIVRGICALYPGVENLSENIQVKSIVGEFLEHTRLYYFKNSSMDRLYIGSADLMGRNLDRRIELLIPISDEDIYERLHCIFDLMWHDQKKSWWMQSDGRYLKDTVNKNSYNVHEVLKKIRAKNDREFVVKAKRIIEDSL